ncbi:protein kinase [Streptomyces qinzhouensis]|uniref:Protein kinase n=1 Tax=Streptomyces qinzhouensis TaxID=2599401 RepID=A0A5B8IIR9_9ACTN|nr:protein kinase [Streptomyces qinzhouensis]QDY77299.1 protein kinase [Streptomyces qinzhouensis]
MTERLPDSDFLALVEPFTGPVKEMRPTERGFMSDVLVLIDGGLGRFFVKGVRNRAGGRRDSLVRERLINEAVRAVSPGLRWHTENDRWMALGFEQVGGRPSRFEPGSPDLPAVLDLLGRIGDIPLPDRAEGWHETRWDTFTADEAEAQLFRGDSLIHGDVAPGNFLVGDSDSWAVDWAWPTRGAGFIDPSCLVLQLIAAGHSPEGAEALIARNPAWSKADPRGIDAFAGASLRMFRHRAERFPEQSWLRDMEATAQAWVDHRSA